MRKVLFVASAAVGLSVVAFRSAEAQKKEPLKPIQPAAVSLGRPVDFEKDVLPILDGNCIACHNLAINESKLVLEDVPSILKGGKRGTSVVPKDPDKSLLYRVAARGADPVMPPLPNKVEAAALTPKDLGILRQWILEGATAGAGGSGAAVAWSPLSPAMKAIYSVAISPYSDVVAAGRANTIHLYDAAGGAPLGRLLDPALDKVQAGGKPMYPQGASHRDFVHSLAFSPDGRLLASGGFRVVKLWQKVDLAKTFDASTGIDVTALAVSADRKWAAVGGADKSLKLVSLADGKTARTLAGHEGPVTAAQFSADGTQIVSGSADKSIRVWSTADGKQLAKIDAPAPVTALVLTGDGKKIAAGHADNGVRIWAVPAADAKPEDASKPLFESTEHTKPVTSLALVTPAGTQVVSGSEDGSVKVWDTATGKALRTMAHGAPVTGVAVRPDGVLIASVSSNGTGILWTAANGQQKARLEGSADVARKAVDLTEDATVAKQKFGIADAAQKAADKGLKDREEALKKAKDALPMAEKTAKEAEAKLAELQKTVDAAKAELAKKADDAALKKKVTDAETAATKQSDETKKAQTGFESAKRVIEQGETALKSAQQALEDSKKVLAVADAAQKKADADLAAAKQPAAAPAPGMQSVAFSADGKTIAVGGADGSIGLWNGDTGTPTARLAAHKGAVASLAFGAEQTILAAGADKTAAAWNLAPPWQLVATLGPKGNDPTDLSGSPFNSRVLSLDFSRDGKLLAAGGGDPSRTGEILLFDVAKKSFLKAIPEPHSDTVMGLEFSRDGSRIVSGAADKFVKLFDVASGKLIRSFEGHTNHVLDVSLKADGSLIVSAGADNEIKVWNTETGEQARTIKTYQKQVTALAFAGADESFVSCGGDNSVRMFKASNGQAYRTLAGSTDFVYAAAVSRDETVVAAGGEDGVLRLWNKANTLIKAIDPPQPPAAPADPKATAEAPAKK